MFLNSLNFFWRDSLRWLKMLNWDELVVSISDLLLCLIAAFALRRAFLNIYKWLHSLNKSVNSTDCRGEKANGFLMTYRITADLFDLNVSNCMQCALQWCTGAWRGLTALAHTSPLDMANSASSHIHHCWTWLTALAPPYITVGHG